LTKTKTKTKTEAETKAETEAEIKSIAELQEFLPLAELKALSEQMFLLQFAPLPYTIRVLL
jgi:hypothetical protein